MALVGAAVLLVVGAFVAFRLLSGSAVDQALLEAAQGRWVCESDLYRDTVTVEESGTFSVVSESIDGGRAKSASGTWSVDGDSLHVTLRYEDSSKPYEYMYSLPSVVDDQTISIDQEGEMSSLQIERNGPDQVTFTVNDRDEEQCHRQGS